MKVITNANLRARCGLKVRKQYVKYYNMGHKAYACVHCHYRTPSVNRVAKGIWQCKKCKISFVGYAYHPYSDL